MNLANLLPLGIASLTTLAIALPNVSAYLSLIDSLLQQSDDRLLPMVINVLLYYV
jgi:replication initiation and membrane attachment protein DnaB